MIKIFIQYSYGGFKTLLVEGLENELVNQEVANENDYGFPQDAYCHFQYGGVKMIYRHLNSGQLDLVVREIPSIHTDGDGRSIPCAVQFIGAPEDRNVLDYMAIEIANNIQKFHDFFSNLFWEERGLRIEGDKLREWIDGHNVPFICDSPSAQIKNIPNIKSGVILFVPMSGNYGIDKNVTDRMTKELRLPADLAIQKDRYIGVMELDMLQGKSNITSGVSGTPTDNGIPEESSKDEQIAILKNKIAEKDKEITNLKKRVNDDVERMRILQSDKENLQAQNNEMADKLVLNKKIVYAVAATAAVLGLILLFK